MKKLFIALALSLVGLFFSNFIIPSSSENVEKTEVVNSMLPYQTISMINYTGVEVTVFFNNTTTTLAANGGSWNESVFGNSLTIEVEIINPLPPLPPVVGDVRATYKAYPNNSGTVKPICVETYTFTATEMKEFTCLTSGGS